MFQECWNDTLTLPSVMSQHSKIPNILEVTTMDHFSTNGFPLLVIFVDKHMWNFTLAQLNLAWQTIILFFVNAMLIEKGG